MITRENYEIWMIDYLDGALDAAGVEEMEAFLAANPDVREEIEGLEDVHLQAPDVKMGNKSALLKDALPCPAQELDNRLVALLEGDLNSAQEKETKTWIAENAEVAKVWSYIQQSRIAANEEAFSGKSKILIAEKVDLAIAEHRMVALMEGDLSLVDRQAVEAEIAGSKEMTSAYGLLKATKIQADQSLVYANKEALYKTAVIPLFAYARYAAGVAAAILLGVFVWNNFSTDEGDKLADRRTNSVVREFAAQSVPVISTSSETVVIEDDQKSASSPIQISNTVDREVITIGGMESRYAPALASNDELPVMQGAIKTVQFATYVDEESETLYAENTVAEKVGGLAGVLVDKTMAIMPQALALSESPAAENAKKMWDQYRDQKVGGTQVDKFDDLASNERVLFSLGKIRVSKKN